jgi:DNA (cytosine-5)-methyltransferase 1
MAAHHIKLALVQVAFVSNGNSTRETGGFNVGHAIDVPMSTITGQRQKSVVAVTLGAEVDLDRAAQVAAFLIRYNGTSLGQSLHETLSTVDTRDRMALVTVNVHGCDLVVGDIGYRLLGPRELFRATGFLDSYKIDPLYNGKPLTRTAQIRMCGNAVPPDPAEALISANCCEAA